jgi:hypothetical protein
VHHRKEGERICDQAGELHVETMASRTQRSNGQPTLARRFYMRTNERLVLENGEPAKA